MKNCLFGHWPPSFLFFNIVVAVFLILPGSSGIGFFPTASGIGVIKIFVEHIAGNIPSILAEFITPYIECIILINCDYLYRMIEQ